MNVSASMVIVVEDSLDDVTSLRDRYEDAGRNGGRSGRGTLPPLQAWSVDQARQLLGIGEAVSGGQATARTTRLHGPSSWDGTEFLLVDCWDWDSLANSAKPSRSVFFVLDVLAALRRRAERGDAMPTVIAYSSSMRDPLIRAALGEFTAPLVEVTTPSRERGLQSVHRRDIDRSGGGVLRGMYERSVLEGQFYELARGDLSGSMGPPPPESTVWADFGPRSCLATFHAKLRDTYPEVWEARVLGTDPSRKLRESERKGILRIGLRYLEPDPRRGAPYFQGYLEIARRLANPGSAARLLH